ncbi:MAG: hypothetical protein U0Z44_10905 [Kouleothrix sp.]
MNGAPALPLFVGDVLLYSTTLTLADGRIQALHTVLNPDKLAYLRRQLMGSAGHSPAWAEFPHQPLPISITVTTAWLKCLERQDVRSALRCGRRTRRRTMTRVLVTGGNGGLGREVVAQLRAAGYMVRVMSRSAAPCGSAGRARVGDGRPCDWRRA